MKTNENSYYIPLTINELADGLRGIVRNSKELTGQELVIGVEYINDDDWNIPPGSIAVYIQQNTLDPEEPTYGTVVLTPGKSRQVM